jgi:hypothetical protein
MSYSVGEKPSRSLIHRDLGRADSSIAAVNAGRGGEIRTPGLLLPKQAR